MIAVLTLYIVGTFIAAVFGLMTALENLDWQKQYTVNERERARQDFVEGWQVFAFSWAWPVLILLGLVSLARKVRHAQQPSKEDHAN